MEQIGLMTIWNTEEIMPQTKRTMMAMLMAQKQIMVTIGLTLPQLNWELTLKIMALLSQGWILHLETILPFQVNTDTDTDTDTDREIEADTGTDTYKEGLVNRHIDFSRTVEPNCSQWPF